MYGLSILFLTLLGVSGTGCDSEGGGDPPPSIEPVPNFYYGADLSYVNEMLDCGATYFDKDGAEKDPYAIFAEAGTNIARFRLWHTPDWSGYSDTDDVKLAISRARDEGMQILLDFHYSDTWADPATQEIPAAWADKIDDTEALGQLLYDYTYNTLNDLRSEGLLPEIVQIGNEINPMILQQGELEWPINWTRNAYLINSGLQAVLDINAEFNVEVETMLHIAQPENALWWFEQATANGVNLFDWIGVSYYPLWSDYTLSNVSVPLKTLTDTYGKKLMVVETAYPWTMEDGDAAGNILGSNALISGYPASEQGQLDYMKKLKEEIIKGGGEGLVYWEPAWVSTGCSTPWGTGSHWDNATLFDHNNKANLGMSFYNESLE